MSRHAKGVAGVPQLRLCSGRTIFLPSPTPASIPHCLYLLAARCNHAEILVDSSTRPSSFLSLIHRLMHYSFSPSLQGNKVWTPWSIKWAYSRFMFNLYPTLPGKPPVQSTPLFMLSIHLHGTPFFMCPKMWTPWPIKRSCSCSHLVFNG